MPTVTRQEPCQLQKRKTWQKLTEFANHRKILEEADKKLWNPRHHARTVPTLWV